MEFCNRIFEMFNNSKQDIKEVNLKIYTEEQYAELIVSADVLTKQQLLHVRRNLCSFLDTYLFVYCLLQG